MVKIAEMYPQWTAILVDGTTFTILEITNYVGESLPVALQNVLGTQNMRGIKDWVLSASHMALVNTHGDRWVVMPEDFPADQKEVLAKLIAAGDRALWPAVAAPVKTPAKPMKRGNSTRGANKVAKPKAGIDFGKKIDTAAVVPHGEPQVVVKKPRKKAVKA